MTEKPILFTASNVRALLDGRKTQTRRVIKPERYRCLDLEDPADVAKALGRCPYGNPGDQLWVKEKHYVCELLGMGVGNAFLVYQDEFNGGDTNEREQRPWRHDLTPKVKFGCRPSIFMPRWASRIDLRVTGIRVERVQDIDWQDALEEGIEPALCGCHQRDENGCTDCMGTGLGENPVDAFAALWDGINKKRGFGWESNPWVWCVDFERIDT